MEWWHFLFAGKLVTYFMNLSVNYELFTRLVVYSKSYVADGDLVEENLVNLNDPVADLNMVSNSRKKKFLWTYIIL